MERYAGALEEAVDGARQQERHYQLLSALQSLVKELPSSFQQRLSYTTLSDLALALLDGTVFEIVQGLLEIQHLTEKSLYNQRLRLQNEHRVLRQALRQKHQEAQQACRPHNLPVLQAAQQRELEDCISSWAGPAQGSAQWALLCPVASEEVVGQEGVFEALMGKGLSHPHRGRQWSTEFARSNGRWTKRSSWSWTGKWRTSRAHWRRRGSPASM
ncbi:protein DGCR6 isoform X2 [Equus asinus]|uniref:protein DGCR6 isoform X2 n=1 Tax=Equus asinus TaxID=9793 RepID=UPI001D055C0E|nr:protein DGCR6L isoform X2 [Equus asinus]XP_044631459.1 protein DGCR6L isoform X2 [Equus asinus]